MPISGLTFRKHGARLRDAMTRPLRTRPLILLVCLALAVALAGGGVAYRIATSRVAETLDQSLTLTRRAIETEIDRFRYLPRVAAEDVRIGQAITDPQNPSAIDAANRYLETVARASGADQLYLLNDQGRTLAASNWHTPESFVGADYSFRPYFGDAMQTGSGRFYAIGVTTGRPGYFLSSRVTLPNGTRAVIVVKVDLVPLQDAWRNAAADVAIADDNGIVFLSGHSSWLYKPLLALSPEVLARVSATRRYEGVALDTTPPLLSIDGALQNARPVDVSGRWLLMRRLPIDPDGWQVLSALPARGALRATLAGAAISGLTALAAALLAQTLLQRRRLVAMRLQQGRLLEQQVERRTRELAEEIETRRAAETELRDTQEALIHSEKMAALGRMSSAIVHEVSQPLAAMEATLAAAAISTRGTDDETTARIESARGHIRRMLRTIRHLKSFGRRETGNLSRVDMDQVVDNALDLVRHRADVLGVTLSAPREGPAPEVIGGLVRLEQVMVNLLLNALDAVANVETRAVTVSREVTATQVILRVTDAGTGIEPAALSKIGEPFYSTKTGGDGLGLGLSISQTIVEDFHGTLRLTSNPGAGTCATITLPRAAGATAVDAA